MKFLLVGFVLLLVAFSIAADYKWKQWIAKRQEDRKSSDHDRH